jgi:hypothetical protein
VNHKLEREEDCDEEPVTEYMLNTIVEEENSYEDLAATTTTPAYSTVGIVEKTMGADKDRVTVPETEEVEKGDASMASA